MTWTWPLILLFGAGFLTGLGVGIAITRWFAEKEIKLREDTIDELIWQQNEFERVLSRDHTRH